MRFTDIPSRIFEVTKQDGKVVWEFQLPLGFGVYRAQGRQNHVATCPPAKPRTSTTKDTSGPAKAQKKNAAAPKKKGGKHHGAR